jgi:hypothetical protein
MALINCKECDNKVSSTAASCPKCGAPIAGRKTEQTTGIDSVIVLGSCVFGLFLAMFVATRFNEDQIPLRFAFGFTALIAPPAAALYYTSRRKN